MKEPDNYYDQEAELNNDDCLMIVRVNGRRDILIMIQ